MPRLSEVIGSIMAGVTHARRIADAEAVRIAEVYKEHEMLKGMSVPRVRLPEVYIDLPVVIDGYINPTEEVASTPEAVSNKVTATVSTLAARENIKLTTTDKKKLSETLVTEFKRPETVEALQDRGTSSRVVYRRAAEKALAKAFTPSNAVISTKVATEWKDRIAEIVSVSAVAKEAVPGDMEVQFLTEQVRASADPKSVIHVRLSLREEGLEWSSHPDDEGVKQWQLTPE